MSPSAKATQDKPGRRLLGRRPTLMHYTAFCGAGALALAACGPGDAQEEEPNTPANRATSTAGQPPNGEANRSSTPRDDALDGPAMRRGSSSDDVGERRPFKDADGVILPYEGESALSIDAIEIDPDELIPRNAETPVPEADRQLIVELVELMQPLRESLTSDHFDRQYQLTLKKLEEIEATGRQETGWAALHAFSNYPGEHRNIRRRLLQVGARQAPEKAKLVLAPLAFTYGYRMSDRAEAVMLLGEVAPDLYMEQARKYLERPGKPFQTAPEDEFFLRGWISACETSGRSPVPMLAQVATNFALGQAARHRAAKELRKYADDPLARGALEAVIVESSGNGYIRRMAAQSILAGYPKEEACQLLEAILRRESDINFGRFLDEMVQENCR